MFFGFTITHFNTHLSLQPQQPSPTWTGDSPSAWTEMVWRMKKTDPTPWRKVRENLWAPEAIALLQSPQPQEVGCRGFFSLLLLHFHSRVCGDDFKEHFPSAGSCVLGLHWRQEGWKKKEGGREESLAWLVWRGGEGGGEMTSQLGLGRGFIQPTLQGSACREPVWKVTLPCR